MHDFISLAFTSCEPQSAAPPILHPRPFYFLFANASSSSTPLRSSIQLSETILHVLVERGLVAGVPPTEGWSALRDICGSPHDPQLIDFTSGFVVGNKDVEIASADPVDHEKHRLLGRPSPVRLIADPGGDCEPSRCPPRAVHDKSAKLWVEWRHNLT